MSASAAPTTPIVASNASLAPVVDSNVLQSAATHLHHVPLTAADSTEFGGFHAHAPLPGKIGQQQILHAQPIAQQPLLQQQPMMQQPLVQQPLVQQPLMQQPLVQQPLVQQPLIQQPLMQQTLVQQPVLLQQQPAHLPAGPVTPAGVATPAGTMTPATPAVNFWSEEETAKLVTLQEQQRGVAPVGAQPTQSAMIASVLAVQSVPQEQQADVAFAAATDVPNNASLAQRIQGELLRTEKGELHHVTSAQAAPGAHGSIHPAGAIIPPSSSALLAEKQLLHHVKLNKAPVTASGGQHLITAPDAHIVPTQTGALGGEASNNAALAKVIQPAELSKGHKQLEHVDAAQQLLPSSYGGQHARDAQLGHAAIDSAALQHVKEHNLHHVPIEQAPHTLSGGVHLLGQPDLTHIVPEAAYDQATLATNNAALVGVVQPAQLAAAHKTLHSVPVATQPSQYGGLHPQGAQTGVVADRVALQYVREQGLKHVALESAPATASGGKHLLSQPDLTLVPEQALSNAPHNMALAGMVSDTELRHEKRALHHVPIERQHPTMTGGIHMADTAATEPLSLLDRFKSVIGLTTAAEQRAHNEPAPGLGRVVERIPVAIQAHTIETPAQAAGAPSKLAAAPQNAQLAQVITPQQLQAEHQQLLPVAGTAALAPIVSQQQLQAEHMQLHPVGGVVSAEAAPRNAQLAERITPQQLQSEQLLPVAGSAALAPVISEQALRSEQQQLLPIAGSAALAPVVSEQALRSEQLLPLAGSAALAPVVSEQALRSEQQQLLPIAGSAALAPVVSEQALRSEHLLPVAGSAALAPVISAQDLQAEHAQLQHVSGAIPQSAAAAPLSSAAALPEKVLLVEEQIIAVPVVTVTEVTLPQKAIGAIDAKQLPAESAMDKEDSFARGGEQAAHVPIR